MGLTDSFPGKVIVSEYLPRGFCGWFTPAEEVPVMCPDGTLMVAVVKPTRLVGAVYDLPKRDSRE